MGEEIFKALNNYFSTLKVLGYKSYEEVDKLLYLIAMEDITSNDFDATLSEQDYRDINQSIYCLFGTDCMFPYPKQCKCLKDGV